MSMQYRKSCIVELVMYILFFVGLSEKAIAQNKSNQFNDLPYKEIQKLELEALEKEDWDELLSLANNHIKKAKVEDNIIEVARGYYYMTVVKEPTLALQYADSMIQITQNSIHPNYPTLGYSLKGHLYFSTGNIPLALENYLIAYNIALEKENIEHQREISLAVAAIRNINGQHFAAAELYKRSLKLLKTKKDYQNKNYEEYMILLYNLSLTHLRLQEVDSAKYYALKGIDQSLIEKDQENYIDFVLLDAQVNFFKNEFAPAKDTIIKYLDPLTGTNKAIKLYYLGKIEEKLGNPRLTIKYFKEIDSIISVTEDPFSEVEDVYQQLMMHSLQENNKRKQVEYIGKLIYYDSVLSTEKENVINSAMASYDIPFLKYQKKEAEEQLRTKERYVVFAGFLAGIGSLAGLFFYTRSRRMKTKLQLLLNEDNEEEKAVKATSESKFVHSTSVPEDIRNDLLKKLEAFEKSERVLCKDLDLSSLAEELGTNTSYLSVIINHYKQMTFPNYLKDLRISIAIERLKEDSQLLKYNYNGLAEDFGFKTGESFSKAFYKKTGVYPIKFITELKARKSKGDL